MALTDKLTAIGDAIRAGTGKTDLLTLDEMPGEIAGLGGGTVVGVGPKAVNFYDYDGTILYAYTVEEMMALTELPPLPSHKGLVCQGWNWTLEGLQAAPRPMNVGAMYITDDGKTRLYIRIDAEPLKSNVGVLFYQSVSNGVTLDWGDGSETETVATAGYRYPTHDYADVGEYVITLDPADGCELALGQNSSNCVMGSTATNRNAYRNMLRKVEIGRGMTSIGNSAFRTCGRIESVTIPQGVTALAIAAFRSATVLNGLILPAGLTGFADGTFSYANIPRVISFPDSLTNPAGTPFYSCALPASVIYPGGVATITATHFYGCTSVASYDFTRHTTVPILENTGAFTNIQPYCKIYVPAALVDEWKAATNWATYADYIVGV